MNRSVFKCIAILSFGPLVFAADPFAEGVRTTEPLTPAEQQKTFHLPPGFEIELVTSEPNIRKPMNMAFDARGRLWVTDSREYPFAAPLDKPARDAIKVFEDTDGDGKYDKVTTFVDGLNIPTGVYPYKNGVVAWSIPNIWYFEDTDGDGKADKRTVLFGPLGWERDTHGMDSSFRRGNDGWLYMTHGFNNNTTVRAKDGSEIKMNSGNIYRVQPDASRVEQFTWGQVNPFGLCFDPLGNLYSADCHSAPIYQLLRGGYYPSFGKPDDGLGFAPTLMEHSHGSTAIAGIIYYDDQTWPAEYVNHMFIGNVMTSRVNHDKLVEHGSTKIAIEQPDFVRTDDPWFRPVDLQYGPDGAFYIADFYNRIIGHYEVPLTHPGRDRERGRIWRIVYKGDKALKAGLRRFDVSKANAGELIAEMGDSNPTRRSIALNELVDRLGNAARPDLEKGYASAETPLQKANILWALRRTGGVPQDLVVRASNDSTREVRTHLLKVLSETPKWSNEDRLLAVKELGDSDAFVKRAAADALGQHAQFENIQPLLALREKVPAEDTHLLHVVRMALRNQLIPSENFSKLGNLSESQSRAIADVAVAIPSEAAAAFLLETLDASKQNAATLNRYLRHAARYAPTEAAPKLAKFVRAAFAKDLDSQLSLFKGVQDGMAQRGANNAAGLKEWGEELTTQLLKSVGESANDWQIAPVPGAAKSKSPWFLQQRASADGNKDAWFLGSLPPGGEQLTGIIRSKPFPLPRELSFFAAGHDGDPSEPLNGKNFIRLRDASSGAVLMESHPPRNDLAQRIKWDLSAHNGKTGYIEITDGHTGSAYAWLAVGRFEPTVVAMPKSSPSQTSERLEAAAELARTLKLSNLSEPMGELIAKGKVEGATATALATTIAANQNDEQLLALAPLFGESDVPAGLINDLRRTFATGTSRTRAMLLEEAFRSMAYRVQMKMAQSLAASAEGGDLLLKQIEAHIASPRLLQERSVHDKLVATKAPNVESRLSALTQNLSKPSEQTEKLLQTRRDNFGKAKTDTARGQALFEKNCAICHQIDGKGAVVGPQLDGIGNRGLERLIEDVLDPNRNVDRAFRTHLFVLKDGDVVTGLPRREQGEVVVVADSTGKEISIQKKNIEQRRESDTSLMPENFADVLSEPEFADLMAFLLSKVPKNNAAIVQ